MKKINKYMYIWIFLSVLISAGKISAQDPPAVRGAEADFSLMVINSADLLDRGSAFVNSSFIKGAVGVSDFSGNLTIGHSMSINYPNDLKTKLTLIFNSNASHAYFEDIVSRTNDNEDLRATGTSTRENSVNAACWIFGVNGIALQTTNFEKNFFMGADNDPDEWIFSGTEVPLLATGYNYTNDVNLPGTMAERNRLYSDSLFQPLDFTVRDAIRIMNAEGAVITLRNPVFRSSPDSYSYFNPVHNHLVGKYFNTDEKSNGYALVEWTNPDSVYGTRKIYYKAGDGLNYFFEEEYVTYQNYSQKIDWGNRFTNPPKIAYLKYIESQNGDRIDFTYDSTNIFGTTITNGRKFLTKIQYYKTAATAESGTEINFSYVLEDSTYKILVENELSNENYTISLSNNPHFIGGFNTLERNPDSLRTSIMMVDSIKNNLNQDKKATFAYSNHIRQYCYGALDAEGFDNNGGSTLGNSEYYYMKYATNKLTSREIFNGEINTFTYHDQYELNSDILLYDADSSYNLDFLKPENKPIGYDSYFIYPLNFTDKMGYYINTYSLNPNQWWSYYRNYDGANIVRWYKYFLSYHYANMYNTMRDNYTSLMIKKIKNSVSNGSTPKNISEKEYNYSWDHSAFGGSGDYPDNYNDTLKVRSDTLYDDLSPRITNILTEIKTRNLDTGSLNHADSVYTEKKYFEQLKVTSKFRRYYSYPAEASNIITELRPTMDLILNQNDSTLQSVEYHYNEELDYDTRFINGYAWARFYDLHNPDDLSLKYKIIKYGNMPKVKVYNSEEFYVKPYFPDSEIGLYRDSCLVKSIMKQITTTLDTCSAPEFSQSIKTENSFANDFGITDTGTAWMNNSYIYKPSLPSETLVYGKKGSGDWIRKSKKTMSYYPSNNYKIGRLWQEYIYGSETNNSDPVTTTYDYNTTGDYKGYLHSITQNSGVATTYEYNGETGYTAYGKLACTNGAVNQNISHIHGSFQPEPFKTTKTYNGKTIVIYTGYDGKGNLLFSTDENGYYTTNVYDALGRIKKTFKPGSYDPNYPTLPLYPEYYNNKKGSVLYEYNDALWTPVVTTTAYFNSSENDTTATKTISKFNPSELAYENYFDAVNPNNLVSKEKFNYLGKKINSIDAMGRNIFYHYDDFMNADTIRFISNSPAAPAQKQIVEYDKNSYYFKIVKSYDEENKLQTNYYDLFGNVVQNSKGGVPNALSTLFTYNGLNQLVSVTSPGYKVTTYEYDEFGNVNKKISPDEGTTKFMYDKFGRLRFKFHIGTGELVFNNYDALNRLVSTGVVDTSLTDSAFNNLEAEDPNPGIDDNSANFVLVNVYDDYNSPGGVFAGQTYPFGAVNLKGKLTAAAYRDKPGNNWNYDFISYDHLGRIAEQKTGSKQLTYNYDNLGNVTEVNINGDYKMLYEYDTRSRLKEVYSDKGAEGDSLKLEAGYTYFNDGQINTETKIITPLDLKLNDLVVTSGKKYTGQRTVKADTVQIEPGAEVIFKAENKITLKPGFHAKSGSAFRTKLETVAYDSLDKLVETNVYDSTRGFLLNKTDNNYKVGLTGTTNPEVFYQRLAYYKNGNVDTIDIRNNQQKGNWPELVYDYSYDAYNRLTGAACNVSQFGSTYSYDGDGNFITKNTGNDNILYSYVTATNKLTSVASQVKGTKSFSYDAKGRMTTDNYSGVTLSNYNYQNLPLNITANSSTTTYSYNGNGERITKNNEYYLRDYAGRELAIYNNTADTLKSVNLFGNGMIGIYLSGEDKSMYFAKDHLGTVRTTINETGEIENATDYYPYGEEITGRSVNYGQLAKYKFTGKERDTETSYDYFGARYYDSQLGRWLQVDPLADKYPGWSPYNYVLNNPLRFVDPKGMEAGDGGEEQSWLQKLLSLFGINNKQSQNQTVKEPSIRAEETISAIRSTDETIKKGTEEVKKETIVVLDKTAEVSGQVSEGTAILSLSTTGTPLQPIFAGVSTVSGGVSVGANFGKFLITQSQKDATKVLYDLGSFGLSRTAKGVINSTYLGNDKALLEYVATQSLDAITGGIGLIIK